MGTWKTSNHRFEPTQFDLSLSNDNHLGLNTPIETVIRKGLPSLALADTLSSFGFSSGSWHYECVEENTINKKILLIFAGLVALILSGELMLPVLEEVGVLALEWAHKTLDLLYEHVFGLGDEASKKASAWTGLFLLIGLIVWGCIKLHQYYLRVKAAMPSWWAETKSDLKLWWAGLSWMQKIGVVILLTALLGVLAMFI